MGVYYCPDCGRPEGELHKVDCRYDTGFEVSWHDRNDELQAEFERNNAEQFPHG